MTLSKTDLLYKLLVLDGLSLSAHEIAEWLDTTIGNAYSMISVLRFEGVPIFNDDGAYYAMELDVD